MDVLGINVIFTSAFVRFYRVNRDGSYIQQMCVPIGG